MSIVRDRIAKRNRNEVADTFFVGHASETAKLVNVDDGQNGRVNRTWNWLRTAHQSKSQTPANSHDRFRLRNGIDQAG